MIVKHSTPEEQHWLNVQSWFRQTGGPIPKLLSEELRLSLNLQAATVTATRCFTDGSLVALEHLRRHSRDVWTLGTNLPDHRPFAKPSSCDGGRELRQVRYALQWILHEVRLASDEIQQVIEIDFDGWNPNEGAGPAILHVFVEWLPHKLLHKQTNPFKVARYRKWLT